MRIFNRWLRIACFKKPPKYAEDLARMAWNAAIDSCEEAIDSCDGNDDDSGNLMRGSAINAVLKLKVDKEIIK